MKIVLFLYNIFTWLLSKLPLPLIYFFSDILYVILYKTFGYRKKVVQENLSNSFPEKSAKELRAVEQRFFHHLCDLMIENMLLPHISEKQIRKRCTYLNPELIETQLNKGKSVICVTGHYSNWEFLSGYQLQTKFKIVAVYKPLSNKHFDTHFKKMREKFDAETAAMNDAVRVLLRYKSSNTQTLSLFIADQSPTRGQSHYWTEFLNQETSIFTGVERIAQKTGFPVIFLKMRKISREQYVVETEMLREDPQSAQANFITEAHVRTLENLIREQPEYWLWSHRRWKHKRETTTSEN